MPHTDPDPAADLTPDQRRREVARLLAAGLLRFRRGILRPTFADSESPSRAPQPLDVRGESRLNAATRAAG